MIETDRELCIGVFWIDLETGKVYSVKYSQAEALLCSFEHVDFLYLPLPAYKAWDIIRRQNPKWSNACRDDVPGGIVHWLKGTKSFSIALHPCLKPFEDAIRAEFNIKDEPCDFHYRDSSKRPRRKRKDA